MITFQPAILHRIGGLSILPPRLLAAGTYSMDVRPPSQPLPPIDCLSIRDGLLLRNGRLIAGAASSDPAEVYRALNCSYPKFFKMDSLCKWAWLGAEALLKNGDGSWLYEGIDKRNIAVVIATKDGCLDVDHRYAGSMQRIASPALFVYTLPNIMLGEICIRHGFTGEQLCTVQEDYDTDAQLIWLRDMLGRGTATHCLFGWADAAGGHIDVRLCWTDSKSLESLGALELQTVHIDSLFPAR